MIHQPILIPIPTVNTASDSFLDYCFASAAVVVVAVDVVAAERRVDLSDDTDDEIVAGPGDVDDADDDDGPNLQIRPPSVDNRLRYRQSRYPNSQSIPCFLHC